MQKLLLTAAVLCQTTDAVSSVDLTGANSEVVLDSGEGTELRVTATFLKQIPALTQALAAANVKISALEAQNTAAAIQAANAKIAALEAANTAANTKITALELAAVEADARLDKVELGLPDGSTQSRAAVGCTNLKQFVGGSNAKNGVYWYDLAGSKLQLWTDFESFPPLCFVLTGISPSSSQDQYLPQALNVEQLVVEPINFYFLCCVGTFLLGFVFINRANRWPTRIPLLFPS